MDLERAAGREEAGAFPDRSGRRLDLGVAGFDGGGVSGGLDLCASLLQRGLLERSAPADQIGDRRHAARLVLGASLAVAAIAGGLGFIRLFSRRTQPPGAHSDTPDDRRFEFTNTPCTNGQVL